MKLTRHLLVALVAAGPVGCVSLPADINGERVLRPAGAAIGERVPLTVGTLGRLEGRYAYASTVGGPLFDRYGYTVGDVGRPPRGLAATADSAEYFTVEVQDPRRVVLTAYAGGVPVAGRVLEGSVNGAGYFESGSILFGEPAFPLLWRLGSEKVGLGVSESGGLLVVRAVSGAVLLLVAPIGATSATMVREFARQGP